MYFLALMLFGGLFFSRFAKIAHLPNVTGYLFAGLLIGPYMLNLIPLAVTENMSMISDLALGFIAFSIGGEFKLSYFKRVGITPIVIAIFEALVAVVLVDSVLILAGVSIPFALVLGSIAAATAPAATIMVIKQYKAKGPVTETLLSVVAIDDAVALILFGLSIALAKAMTNSGTSILESILTPAWEISFSIIGGMILGTLLTFFSRFFESRGNRLSLAFGFVLFALYLSSTYDGSSLLMIMSLSAMYANLYKDVDRIMELTERATPPLFMLFFVLSGAHLDLSILPSVGMIGTIYILFRVIGKYIGAYLGAKITNAPEKVRTYLGPALIPQAGVAIGLTFVAQTVVPEYAPSIRAVILCGTLIYELIGPAITKISLQKAGEIEMAPKATSVRI